MPCRFWFEGIAITLVHQQRFYTECMNEPLDLHPCAKWQKRDKQRTLMFLPSKVRQVPAICQMYPLPTPLLITSYYKACVMLAFQAISTAMRQVINVDVFIIQMAPIPPLPLLITETSMSMLCFDPRILRCIFKQASNGHLEICVCICTLCI